MIDPIAAATNAIVAYFAAELPGVRVRRGWPESNVDFDLDAGPILTVTPAGRPTLDPCHPVTIGDDGNAPPNFLYRVGDLKFSAQLDLWCEYRATRDELTYAVAGKLHNQIAFHSGIWVDSSEYHNRPLRIDADSVEIGDETDTAPSGEWRQTWSLTISTDMVVQAVGVRLAQVILRVETEQAGIVITNDIAIE